MIGHALRLDIERWAASHAGKPLFQFAASGRLTKTMVMRYIANVTHLTRQTPAHLKRARDRSRALGDSSLAAHFAQKMGEEVGHAEWGDADLECLRRLVVSPSTPELTPSIRMLVSYIEQTIDQDPACYLTYIAFAEYVTVLLGPELLRHIEERCGVSRSSMTVVDNHVELDRAHAEEGFAVIDDLVADPRKISALRRTLGEVFAFFDRFCEEVTHETVENDELVRTSAA
jgi:hypothetical protein